MDAGGGPLEEELLKFLVREEEPHFGLPSKSGRGDACSALRLFEVLIVRNPGGLFGALRITIKSSVLTSSHLLEGYASASACLIRLGCEGERRLGRQNSAALGDCRWGSPWGSGALRGAPRMLRRIGRHC